MPIYMITKLLATLVIQNPMHTCENEKEWGRGDPNFTMKLCTTETGTPGKMEERINKWCHPILEPWPHPKMSLESKLAVKCAHAVASLGLAYHDPSAALVGMGADSCRSPLLTSLFPPEARQGHT